MKRYLLIIVFIFFSFGCFAADIVVVAPFSGGFSNYAIDMLNGFKLALPAGISLSKVDEFSKDFLSEVESCNPRIIIGPFMTENVDNLTEAFCNKPVVVILPFARPRKSCFNVFYYGFNPITAVHQLSQKICQSPDSSIVVFYSMDKLSRKERDVFLDEVKKCGALNVVDHPLPSFVNLYGNLIKDVFDIVKVGKISGLTEKKIFKQQFFPDKIIVFASAPSVVNLLSMLDYYDVKSGGVFVLTTKMSKDFASLNLSAVENVKIIIPYFICNKARLNVNFVDQYRKTYGDDPSQFSALGFDIGNLLLETFAGKNLKDIKDEQLVLGRLMFFDDSNRAVLDYPILNAKEVRLCTKQILSR
ncbi:hypothetical protein [Hippea maritima]|uniref:Leucine-binding protein domain-containing protein n=1 Tax=Hippea maritima (strain ATCC 700847 / DSM 10411 / MH2) TaxID=760142 RepID=F2LXL7_HIPMA|nr:hypothetical protein [Hippea maritima]AEA33203.1 hypothetical protein Hipma_0226 [Hippea maritima DSM 10411]